MLMSVEGFFHSSRKLELLESAVLLLGLSICTDHELLTTQVLLTVLSLF